MTFTHALSTNNYGPEKFIVSASAAEGTHTTIAAALTAASSGDTIFIRPGTYTENLTLKAGVNIVANEVDAYTPNVTIIGKATFTAAGTVSISGIRLQTNSDFALAVTGSAASVVNLYNCFLNFSNNTGISFTSSSGSSQIVAWDCRGNLGTTGIAYFAHSGAGSLGFLYCNMGNTGGSSTQNTISGSGSFVLDNSFLASPLSFTGTSGGGITWANLDTSAQNVTALTINIAGTITSDFSKFVSGTATPCVVTGGSLSIRNAELESSNATNISGAGSLNYSNLTFTNANHAITVTSPFKYFSTNNGWSTIATKVASNSATIDFTELVSFGSFRNYVLVYDGLVPATNGATFQIRYSTNGGSTYVTTGYNSGWIQAPAPGTGYTTGATSTGAAICQVCSSASGAASGGHFFMYNLTTSTPATYIGQCVDNVAGNFFSGQGGFGNSTTPINAIRVMFSTGNISSGNFTLYGVYGG